MVQPMAGAEPGDGSRRRAAGLVRGPAGPLQVAPQHRFRRPAAQARQREALQDGPARPLLGGAGQPGGLTRPTVPVRPPRRRTPGLAGSATTPTIGACGLRRWAPGRTGWKSEGLGPTQWGGACSVDLNLSDEQQQLVDSFGALYAKESPPERVRAAEAAGRPVTIPSCGSACWRTAPWKWRWTSVPGAGGPRCSTWPWWPSSTGATWLGAAARGAGGRPPAGPAAGRLGPDTAARDCSSRPWPAASWSPLALRPPRAGCSRLVPAGAVADDVIFFDGSALRHLALTTGRRGRRDGDRRVGTSRRATAAAPRRWPRSDPCPWPTSRQRPGLHPELASGAEAAAAFEEAVNEWMILMAGALVGIGARSLEIGVEYVKERKAFGVPIGSFQAVSHGLADAATALDGGTLLAREAAWSAEVEPAPHARAGPPRLRVLRRGGPGGQLPQPALSRRLRLHARVRHPAVLSPGPGLAGAVRRTGRRLWDGRRPPPVRPSLRRPPTGRPDHGLPTGREERGGPAGGAGLPGRGAHARGAPADGGDRGPPQLGLPSQTGRAGLAGPGLAQGVRRSGSGSPRDPGLRRGAAAGRCADLRRGHHPDDRRRHPAHRHRGAEEADPPAGAAGRDHHRARVHRARVRVRRGGGADPGRPRR